MGFNVLGASRGPWRLTTLRALRGDWQGREHRPLHIPSTIFVQDIQWEANGQENGYTLPEIPDDAWLDQILEDGLTTPGVFNIPICTFSEALHNWYDVFLGEKKEGDKFPCDTK